MREDLLKRESETKLDCIRRIVYGKLVDKTIDEDYTELSELVFGKPYSSDVARRMFYGVRALLDVLDIEQLSNVTESEAIRELEEKKLEIQKERMKLQATKVEYLRALRSESRTELFLEKIEEIADRKSNNMVIPQENTPISDVELLVGITDQHVGSKFSLYGLRGEILNEYSVEIFKQRMWKLYHKIIAKAKLENSNVIRLYDCGDNIEGILHMSQLQSLEMGIVESAMEYQEFMVDWITELSLNGLVVHYYGHEGNHDEARVLTGKKGDFSENMQKMITRYIKRALTKNPNVKVYESQNGLQYHNICGLNILSAHGDNEKNLEQSIKDYIITYGIKIDLFICGHLHSTHIKSIAMNENGNIEFIQLPSLCGANPYSVKIKKATKAGAKILVLGKEDREIVDISF